MKPQIGLEVDEDVDGNPITPPPEASDVGQLIYLLEYGRRRGFIFGPEITINGLVVKVFDKRLLEGERQQPDDPGPWAAHGHVEG